MVKKIFYFMLLVISIITIYPVVYTISMSMSGADEIRKGLVWLYPRGLDFETYKIVLGKHDIWRSYFNTFKLAIGGIIVSLVVTMPAAYALSRTGFILRRVFMRFIMFTMFFSGGFIPLFLLIIKIGLYDSLWAVILPSATGAWFMLITRVYIESAIPQSLYEAAKIEGADDIKIFYMIVLPLTKTIMAVISMFCAVGLWNSYFLPLLFLADKNLRPLSLYLRSILLTELAMMEGLIIGEGEQIKRIAFGLRFRYAAIIITTIPVMAMYPFLQKYFIKGVMIGAVKG